MHLYFFLLVESLVAQDFVFYRERRRCSRTKLHYQDQLEPTGKMDHPSYLSGILYFFMRGTNTRNYKKGISTTPMLAPVPLPTYLLIAKPERDKLLENFLTSTPVSDVCSWRDVDFFYSNLSPSHALMFMIFLLLNAQSATSFQFVFGARIYIETDLCAGPAQPSGGIFCLSCVLTHSRPY